MTLDEMTNEVVSRGFDYVTPGRIESYIQRSYLVLAARYQWPFLESMIEKKAPMSIADVHYVLSATDVTQGMTLYGADRRWLVERFPHDPSLEEAGNPRFWFLDDKIFRAYPTSSDEVLVRYVKRAGPLTAETGPLFPSEWHYLIVDMAVVHCLKDNDEYEAARELNEDVQRGLREMLSDQMQKDFQGSRLLVRTGWPTEYL